MNYIELINQFWRLRRKVRFTAHEADLYFYLLNEANELEWENPFQHATTLICANLGISRKTFTDLRNRLSQKGLIAFTEGQKNKMAATYTLLYVSKTKPQGNIQGNEHGNIDGNIQGNIDGNVQGNHSTKLNQTKPNKKKYKGAGAEEEVLNEAPGQEGETTSAEPPQENEKEKSCGKKEKALVYPFPSESFVRLWHLWKRYKREQHKFSYVSEVTEQTALDQLKPFDEEFATLIIERAMAKGWKGFVHQGTREEYQLLRTKPLNGLQSNNFNRHAGNSNHSSRQPANESIESIEARYR